MERHVVSFYQIEFDNSISAAMLINFAKTFLMGYLHMQTYFD